MIEYLIIMVVIWIISYIYLKSTMSPSEIAQTSLTGIAGHPGGSSSFFALFLWNLGGAAVVVALGIIPLPIYWYYILENAFSVGAVLSVVSNPFLMFAGGVLPHGIFEISGQLFAAAISSRLAWYGMNKLIRRKHEDIKYLELLRQSLTDLVIFVVPLMFIAAIVETYISPIFIKMIMH